MNDANATLITAGITRRRVSSLRKHVDLIAEQDEL